MDEPWKHVKWKKPDTRPRTVSFHLSEISRMRKSTMTEDGLGVASDCGDGGNRDYTVGMVAQHWI